VVTTEKDAVRLAACDLGDLPIASVPLVVGIEPAGAFRRWLFERLYTHPGTADRRSAVRLTNPNPQSATRGPR